MREALPNRRVHDTRKIRVPGLRSALHVTVGYYPDGRPGEVFFDTTGLGSATHALLLGCALLASVALQHGASLSDISHQLREMDFAGIPGAIADVLGDWETSR